MSSSLMATTANARWSVLSRILIRGLKSLCIKRRKQELCDDVNDVGGVIEDVEEIPTDADGGTNCGRAADVLPFNSQWLCRESPRKLSSDHIQRLSCRQMDVPMPRGHDSRGIPASSSASDEIR